LKLTKKEKTHPRAKEVQQKWKEKIKDFLWQTLIIIISVSVTLWGNNWINKKHEQKLVKAFLIGIRENLISDTVKLQDVADILKSSVNYNDEVLRQINENKIDAQFVNSNSNALLNRPYRTFNDALFQSFSSSGNLRLIENQKLLVDITTTYTSTLPTLTEAANNILNQRENYYVKYIGSKTSIDSNYNCKLSAVIHQPEVKFQLQFQDNILKQLIGFYRAISDELVSLVHEIDKELKDNFGYDVEKSKK
jgi:hypothetical protein